MSGKGKRLKASFVRSEGMSEESTESEEFGRILLSQSCNPVIVINPDSSIRYVNGALEELVGYSAAELVGREAPYPWWTEEDVEEVRTAFQQGLDRGINRLEKRFRRKNGEAFWVEITSTPVVERGKLRYFLNNWVDITDRKRAEEALRESNERFRGIAERGFDAIYETDLDGTITYVSAASEFISGNRPDEVVGKAFRDYVPEEALAALGGAVASVLKGCSVRGLEVDMWRKDGTLASLELNVSPIVKEGVVVRIEGTARDVTEHKRAMEALEAEKAYTESVVRNVPDMLVVMDRRGTVTFCNDAVARFVGMAVSDAVGMPLGQLIERLELLAPDIRERAVGELEEHLRSGETVTDVEVELVDAQGRRVPHLYSEAVITNGTGEVLGVTALMKNISERKRAEQEMEQSFVDLAETISRAVESRDPYTAGHQRKVASLVKDVGERMGLDAESLKGLYVGALLHDIGKFSIPDGIINKPGRLSEEEWGLVRVHTRQGHAILDGTRLPWPVAEMALHHHERLDGSGYPDGIRGEQLSLEVRILAVCDVAEAMSSHRPYRPARTKDEVLEELRGGRGAKYDPLVVDIVCDMLEKDEAGFD